MPKSLAALGDDPLRAALSFLSVAECRRSVGASSKHFRALATSTALIGFGNCFASHFRDWVFEAFDGQLADWRVLYDSDGVSPWTIQSGTIQSGGWGAHTLFPVEPSFPSSRFRIRLTNVTHGLGHQCMHIRGFELFGAILPPWRIDA